MARNTKTLLRNFCKYVYYAGAGNHWYENIYTETFTYQIYSLTSFSVYTAMIFLENLAALIGDLPEAEKSSAIMFFAIHNIVLAKMYLFLYHKKSIRKLNHTMATIGDNLEEEHVMRVQYTGAKLGLIFYAVTVYLSLIAFGVESARKTLVEGAPFYTVVTYLPYYEDNSIIATGFRIFFYVTWLYMMLPMMSADCMPIIQLIAIRYKFITLIHHYERLRDVFDINCLESRKYAATEFKKGFLQGIVMHQKLLKLAEEINRVFGIIMSLQVCESSAVAVLLLLRLALSPGLDLTNAFMTYTFVVSLFVLLALNLWNAGEITHQASLLSTAMFHSGWYLSEMEVPSHRDVRSLVLISSTQAQKPLILKAFGIQDLSYATFVSVARMTYSVFAVFYQRDGGN